MQVGIGLPVTVPGVDRESTLEWASRAERRGFPTLGVIDRLVYPNFEPLVALAAAAAVTERIELMTTILIAPYRLNTALLAKQIATVDALSGGRLTVGIAVGAREDDYAASGVPLEDRGRRFDEQLGELKRIWSGEEHGTAGAIGPPIRDGGPPLVLGGSAKAAFRRAAQHGEGWIMGGGTPDQFRQGAAALEEAWSAAGRRESPRKMALAYYALGERGQEAASDYLLHYYAWLGEVAEQIAASAATDEETVRGYMAAFEEAGCEELVFFPSSTDPEQVDLLAAAAL